MNKNTIAFAGLMLFSSFAMATETHYIGVDTYQLGGLEGGTGLTYTYNFDNGYGVVATLNQAYIQGVKNGESKGWHSYNTYALGVNKPLSNFNDMVILSVEAGLEMVAADDKLTTEEDALNTYIQLNMDMPFGFGDSKNWIAGFSMGTSGKGLTADKLKDSPELGHGFVTKFNVSYGF